MSTATLPRLTAHSVVCGDCGTVAPVRSTTLIRDIQVDGFTAAPIVSASLDFVLPTRWAFVDLGDSVMFRCPRH